MSRTFQSFTSAGMPTDAAFTAVIVEHTPYSRYASCLERTILVITDHNDPDTRSVANAIEDVLRLCRQRFGADLPSLAIYRDTSGVWARRPSHRRHVSGILPDPRDGASACNRQGAGPRASFHAPGHGARSI